MRRKPITRDEVRVLDFYVTTVPADSVRQIEYGLGTIERLWKPLIAQLTKEQAAFYAARPDIRAWNARFRKELLKPPRIPHPLGWAGDKTCRHCNRIYYSTSPRSLSPYCSDVCSKAAARAAMVKARADARAKARAGRTCAGCGEPFDAQRATKRFCSTRCRMRGHRQIKAGREV